MTSCISVIVVNYRTATLACAAVQSVLDREHVGHTIDVHLVDNASGDGEREILKNAAESALWQGKVTLYFEDENHGFGRGNNVVLRGLAAQKVQPDKIFFLNPDAQLDNEAIVELAAVLDQNPSVGFVGAGIDQPGTGPVVAAFRFPNPVSEIVRMLGVGFVYRLLGVRQTALPPDHPEGAVDWVAGAAVMARFDVLKQLNFFDPDFFLYFEEVDLIRRANVAGWACWYAPKARVLHSEGAATGVKSGESERKRRPGYWYQSWALYFYKAYGRFGAVTTAMFMMLAACVNLALAKMRKKTPDMPLRFLRDFGVGAALRLLRSKESDL